MLAANSREHVDCVSRVVRNADRLPQAPVPSLIFDSWRRSMEQHHLDPGSLQGPRILTERLLVVASDRVSAFDFALEPGIPGKGELLTTLSLWWFDQLDTVPNHLLPDHTLAHANTSLIPAVYRRATQ